MRYGLAPCGAEIFKTDETSVRAGYPYGHFWYRCRDGHLWDSCMYQSRNAAEDAAQRHTDAHLPRHGFRESGAYQRPDGQWYPFCARCPWSSGEIFATESAALDRLDAHCATAHVEV